MAQNLELVVESSPIPDAVAASNRRQNVQVVSIDAITVVNHRDRSKKRHQQMIRSIAQVGLKKPISVRAVGDGRYELICGEGRLGALQKLGATEAPVLVRDVNEEELLLISLVENVMRRSPPSLDMARQLAALRERGYTEKEIGAKVGLPATQVSDMLYLLQRGEERLLDAVAKRRVSLTAARIIAGSDDANTQTALLQAVEEKKISPQAVRQARTLADARRLYGKLRGGARRPVTKVSSESIVNALRREQQKQHHALKKAELCEHRLLFAVNALGKLLSEESFLNLLRAEGLNSLPEVLAQQIQKGASDV